MEKPEEVIPQEPQAEAPQNPESEELTPEEKKLIEAQRAVQKRKENCVKGINEVLEKYSAALTVDPQSPIGNPRVILSFK